MKNSKIVNFLSIVALLSLVASGAWAYDFTDGTQVEWFLSTPQSTSALGYWSDVIGDKSVYDTLGANLSDNLFTIFTNWNPGKDGDLSSYLPGGGIKTADLFIYNNGTVYAIRLDTSTFLSPGQQEVFTNPFFTNPSFFTSQDMLKGSNLFFGGLYDQASPSLAPVWVEPINVNSGLTSVTWTYGIGNSPSQVTVDLSGLNLGDNWSFFWGTGICDNDAFAGNVSVPEPSILLLLGVGLIGLGGLRRKFKG